MTHLDVTARISYFYFFDFFPKNPGKKSMAQLVRQNIQKSRLINKNMNQTIPDKSHNNPTQCHRPPRQGQHRPDGQNQINYYYWYQNPSQYG